MVNKKLTLSLDKKVIERAKAYAKSNNISLSRLIESYLAALVGRESDKDKITPLVKSLSGVIDIAENFDQKENYTDFLIRKYK